MKDRIRQVREDHELTQAEFAERLSVDKDYVSRLESGEEILNDDLFMRLNLEFNASRAWLKTGEGKPYVPVTDNEKIGEFCGDVMELAKGSLRKDTVLALRELTDDEWIAVADFVKCILDKRS